VFWPCQGVDMQSGQNWWPLGTSMIGEALFWCLRRLGHADDGRQAEPVYPHSTASRWPRHGDVHGVHVTCNMLCKVGGGGVFICFMCLHTPISTDTNFTKPLCQGLTVWLATLRSTKHAAAVVETPCSDGRACSSLLATFGGRHHVLQCKIIKV
jgi:hypothetical protein